MRLRRLQAALASIPSVSVAYLLLTLVAVTVYVHVDASSPVREWLIVAIPVSSILAVRRPVAPG